VTREIRELRYCTYRHMWVITHLDGSRTYEEPMPGSPRYDELCRLGRYPIAGNKFI